MGALKITGQSAEPTVTASDAGTLYYDSDTNKLRHYNGTAWADVSPAAAAITSADLPAGSVLQVKRASIVNDAASGGYISYSTHATNVPSATLDTNGIWRWKNLDGDFLSISDFSASSGNMVVGWWSGGGVNAYGTSADFALGIQWGASPEGEARRTFSDGGANFVDHYYPGPLNHHSSYILGGDLSEDDVHAIVRLNANANSINIRGETGFHASAPANYAQWGDDNGTVFHMTIMEIKQ